MNVDQIAGQSRERPPDAKPSRDENVKIILLFLTSFQGSEGFSAIGSNMLFSSHQSI
jgi:hypothetical protein